MTTRRPGLRRAAALAAAVLVLVFPFVVTAEYQLGLATTIGIYCIVLLGLHLLYGYTGVLSLGQAGFMGLAAYVSAILTAQHGWDPLWAMAAAILATMAVAACMAIPGARLTGFNLALATLGFGVVIEGLLLGMRGLTGGAGGVSGIPPFKVLGYAFESERSYFWLVWGLCGAFLWFSLNLVHSPVGRALRAIKHDELAAATIGINVFRHKVKVLLLASIYAAVAGSLYAHYMRFISPDMVNWTVSTGMMTMIVLGGEGSLWGVFLGAIVLRLVPEIFNGVQDYLLIIQGLILVLLMIYLPSGLWGIISAVQERVRRSRP